jgi:hypothetical protein
MIQSHDWTGHITCGVLEMETSLEYATQAPYHQLTPEPLFKSLFVFDVKGEQINEGQEKLTGHKLVTSRRAY